MKQVKEERLAIVIELTREGANPTVTSCRVDYEVTSEGVTEHRHYVPELNTGQVNAAKGLGAALLADIKQLEK